MIADCPTLPVPALTPEDIARSVRHVPSAPKVLPRLKQMLGEQDVWKKLKGGGSTG